MLKSLVNAIDAAQTKTVTRYAVTHINRDGMRTLSSANQGRLFHDTPEKAKEYLTAMLGNNSEDTLRQVYGEQAIGTFDVRPVECYPNGDAKGIY